MFVSDNEGGRRRASWKVEERPKVETLLSVEKAKRRQGTVGQLALMFWLS